MRIITTLLLLVCLVVPQHARAQTPAPPDAPTLTPAQAQAVLDVLQDDQKRAQFTAVLQNMIKAVPAAKPAVVVPLAADSVGAQLLVQGEHWASELGAQFRVTALAIGDVPQLWRWVLGTAQNPAALAMIWDAFWKLGVIVAASLGIEWGAKRLLAGIRRILIAHAPPDEPSVPVSADAPEAVQHDRHRRFSVAWRMLRRLPFVLAGLVLDLVPVALFAAVGNGLLTTPLGETTNNRLVVLAVVDAYVACRVIMCVIRSVVSPADPRLRLIQVDDASAAYIERWALRLSAVGVFGFAFAEVALLFGLYRSAHDVLIKLVALVIHIMLVIIVLQTRHTVSNRLRARHNATGTIASLQNHFAANWHLPAIFYIVALWLVAAAEIRDGYARLLHFFVVTSATLIASRLVGIVVLGTVDRSVRINPDTTSNYPALEQRISQYYPILRAALIAALSVATAMVLLEIWGFAPLSWFTVGQLGARVVNALMTSIIAVVVAVIVWEAANAAVESKVATLTRAAQTARAARLRTLLPMLRTTLLVALVVISGLVVLSEIGLNIAPLLAGAGVLGVAIGFGSQKLVQDLITGLFLLLENTMQVGDVVALAGLTGTVEYLSIRTIRLRALDGSLHIIPFSSVTTVTNQTRDFAYALVDLPIGLDEEPDRVAKLLVGIVKTMRAEPRWEDSITSELEVMGVYAFTDTNWTMRVRIRTTPSERWAVNREFNRRVKYCFDQNAVQSPITSYRVQGWLPPGAERPIPPPPPREDPVPAPIQDAAE